MDKKFRSLIQMDDGSKHWEYYTTFSIPAWLDFATVLEKDLQYTGLKDKNGKEIYENHELKTFDGEIGYVRYDPCFCVYGIQNKKHFRSFENIFNAWIEKTGSMGGNVSTLIEIIGENPELTGEPK